MKTIIQPRRVTIFGLGLYPQGSGIEAAKYFLKQGSDLIITDLRDQKTLRDQKKRLEAYKKKNRLSGTLTWHLGGHRQEDFTRKKTDSIVKNPAIPPDSIYLQKAHKERLSIMSDTQIFFEHFKGKIIGITGTRGKSTTTQLIYEILNKAKKKVLLGGNIMKSPLPYLENDNQTSSWAVLELPAQQLESLITSPSIGVITNILDDHLNFYKTKKRYQQAKEKIFAFQKKNGIGIFNYDNPGAKKIGLKHHAQTFWFSTRSLPRNFNGCCVKENNFIFQKGGRQTILFPTQETQLLGKHNTANIAAALTVASIMGIPKKALQKAIKTFPGLPFRMEKVMEKHGTVFYNDATSTTPDAATASILTLSQEYTDMPMTLICGGIAKVKNYRNLVTLIEKKVSRVITIPGTVNDLLKISPQKTSLVKTKNLREAVQKAWGRKPPHGIILFSPAGASFNQFNNEIDRAEQFNALIQHLS